MEIIHSLEEIGDRRIVLALGFFDGCHLGHQAVLSAAKELGREKEALIGVCTFFPHPMSLLFPERKIPLLQSESEKEEMLEALGMKLCLCIRPDLSFLNESAEDFLQSLRRLPGLVGLAAGENFSYGKGASGNMADMKRFFAGSRVEVREIPLLSGGKEIVSSTEIREAVRAGDMRKAAALLGRSYTVSGDVVHGFRRGSDILGFPTANLSLPANRLLPKDGVYATRCRVGGAFYPAVTNIGTNPTFGNTERTVETFIFDFDESIYGKEFTLEWVEYLRGEIRFENFEDLKAQIGRDIEHAKEILA